MRALLFIFLSFSFFIIHCGPLEEEERETSRLKGELLRRLNSDLRIINSTSDDPDMAAETRDDDEIEDQVGDITEELEDSEYRFIGNDKGFYADDFVHQEFYSCTKEGEKSYFYELYEEPDDNPYACYLIHRYKSCGRSYSAEKGYCYHNALKTGGYCRIQLEKNLVKRRNQGYVCAPVEEASRKEDSVESDVQQPEEAADSEQQPVATTSKTERAGDDEQSSAIVVEEGEVSGGAEAVDESEEDSGDKGTADDPKEESKSGEEITVPEDAEAEVDEKTRPAEKI